MEGIPEKIDSRFRLVLLAAHRAERMMRGALPKVETHETKPSRVALEEILQDKIVWDYGPAPAVEGEAGKEPTGGEV